MAHLFIDVQLSKANLTLFLDINCFVIGSNDSEYSLRQMLLRVLPHRNTSSLHNALYDHGSSRIEIG